jgi:hypothetical protein
MKQLRVKQDVIHVLPMEETVALTPDINVTLLDANQYPIHMVSDMC